MYYLAIFLFIFAPTMFRVYIYKELRRQGKEVMIVRGIMLTKETGDERSWEEVAEAFLVEKDKASRKIKETEKLLKIKR